MEEEEWRKVGRSRANWRSGVYGTLVLLSGPPAALVTWWLRTKINGNRRKRWLLASCSMFLLSVLWPLRDLVPLWLAPWVGGFVLSGWGPLVVDWSEIGIDKMRYKTAEDRQREWQQDLDRMQFVATTDMKKLAPLPLVDGYLQFGRMMDLRGSFSPGLGMKDLHDALGMELENIFQHMAIIGTTRAGKSWLMKWIAYQILFMTDWDLFVVDCKGSLPFAYEVHNMMAFKRQQQVPLFMLGHEHDEGTVYDGFRGSAKAIFNRLAAMMGIKLMDETDAAYYGNHYRNALLLACRAPDGPPRSFRELYYRLDQGELRTLWPKRYNFEQDVINGLDQEAIKGVKSRISAFEQSFGEVIAPGGFDLEDAPHAAHFCLKTTGNEDDVTRYLFSLVENVKHYMGNPVRQGGRRAVLIIDEFGGVGGRNIELLMQQASESGIAVILSSQDITFLANEKDQRQRIMSLTGTDIYMRTKFPDDLVKMAGEEDKTDTSYQFKGGEATGDGSMRTKAGYIIPPDQLISAQNGVGFVVRRNHAWQIHVPTTPEVPKFPNAVMVKPVTPYVYQKPKPGDNQANGQVVHREIKGRKT